MDTFQIDIDSDEFKLLGIINEHANIDSFLANLSQNSVINLEGITRISSYGVRTWVSGRIKCDNLLEYKLCPVMVVEQFNMIPELLGSNTVVSSFYVPFYCPECDQDYLFLMEKGKHFEYGVEPEIPEMYCQCGCEYDFEAEDDYFAFLKDIDKKLGRKTVSDTLRKPMKCKVKVTFAKDSYSLVLESSNISESGIFLLSNADREQWEKLLLDFQLPDSKNTINIQGEIRWLSNIDDENKRGFGVKFLSISEQHSDLIKNYMESFVPEES